ncbi:MULTISPECIES: hypothetical protein [unclassified Saccharibacter]|uniref:hypothetical protein n=1 Tax=unclassified Saccharibacter TaxID=2648722 RepID=UPI0013282626|nr:MULTISPECIES: hypothetical protein [unclassified Saccharibacter]MXV35836.1 hypothetical protein [Saccharibacter sp. EH611]MXV57957.1 hypothetical protein [Saccharibacter sp. EH70]MXV66352.1 hypothetical protein [Saccharibacter sp. EH60]
MATKKNATTAVDVARDEAVTSAPEHDLSSTEEAKTVTAHLLLADRRVPLKAGQLLIICASPGFRRAGIEHERSKLWERRAFTAEQIDQMRREPLLTLIEVG